MSKARRNVEFRGEHTRVSECAPVCVYVRACVRGGYTYTNAYTHVYICTCVLVAER